jgi:hypothetical protein
VIGLGACRPPSAPVPVFLHSEFKQRGIDEIVLLPAIDLRQVEERLDGNKHVRNEAVRALERRHYAVSAVDDFAPGTVPTEAELERPSPSWIATLGPAKSRWVLLVTIVRFEKHFTIGVRVEADLQGYLFDKEKGELLWQGKGHGDQAVGYFLAGFAERAGLEVAVEDLLKTFPAKP